MGAAAPVTIAAPFIVTVVKAKQVGAVVPHCIVPALGRGRVSVMLVSVTDAAVGLVTVMV